MIDAHEHTHLAGPSAKEAAHRLSVFGERARFPGAVITDQRRLQRLMDRHDPAIYPGNTSPASTNTPPPSANSNATPPASYVPTSADGSR